MYRIARFLIFLKPSISISLQPAASIEYIKKITYLPALDFFPDIFHMNSSIFQQI